MARYLKKNRRHLMGVALPIFFLFLLGAVGLSVFPGWVSPTYGTPGDPCSIAFSGCDSSNPLHTACDVCNGEFCTFDTNTQQRCAVISAGSTVFDPSAVPDFLPCPGTFAGCLTACESVFSTFNTNICQSAVCSPSDAFCDGIAGGDQPSACRSGICTANTSSFDINNPSGCDYQLESGTDCLLCASPAPVSFDACGNGICEPGLGEDCSTCSLDCLLPGFEDVCPLTSGPVIASACSIGDITFITFGGPTYNFPFSGDCEDGDLCTDNSCAAAAALCNATPKTCSINAEDFCCPAGCSPPTTDTCGPNDSGCDIDCYTPEVCEVTPTPTPTPPGNAFLQGSGILSGCSLNRSEKGVPVAWVWLGTLGLLATATACRKHKLGD